VKIVSVVGARPQFVKLGVVWSALRRAGVADADHVIVHTGQHYDRNLSQTFFEELAIPAPRHNLGVGSGEHGEQTGRMLEAVERTLRAESPDLVVVFGDTNSTLAGTLAAVKQGFPVAHVEAGLRSYRKGMAEEINRVLTDHASTILLCPTRTAVHNLAREAIGSAWFDGDLINPDGIRGALPSEIGLDQPLIANVGDVMYDGVLRRAADAARESTALRELGLTPGGYVLATVHRAENTDDPHRLDGILSGLIRVAAVRPVVFPVHPRTRKKMAGRLQDAGADLTVIDPAGYLDFLHLERNAAAIATDSGGVQKEAFFLGVPCVTLRDETEWIETIDAEWNTLTPADPDAIAAAVERMVGRRGRSAPPPLFGDGNAGGRIAALLAEWGRVA